MKTVEVDIRWAGVAAFVYLCLGMGSYEKAWKFGATCIAVAAFVIALAYVVRRFMSVEVSNGE